MPNVQTLLAEEGVTFANAFVTTPLCCPSRASILRGQYAHNHGVLSNSGDNGGFPAFYRLGNEDSTVATWLQDAGYRTALHRQIPQSLSQGRRESHVPPGWDEWNAFASSDEDEGGSYYSDYALNENGATRPLRAAAGRLLDRRARRQGDRFRRSRGRLRRALLPLYRALRAPRSVHAGVSPHRGVRGRAGAARPVV